MRIAASLSQSTMVRALGTLYGAGAGLAIVWTLLPHSPSRGDGVVVAMAVLAMAVGLLLISDVLAAAGSASSMRRSR